MLRSRPIEPVPEEAARGGRAAFPSGHPYGRLADEPGALCANDLFAVVCPTQGWPALAPWRLALLTVPQFAEGRSDRQAADAVRARIDCEYALRLPPTDPGFAASVLSEVHARLRGGEAERALLDTLLDWCRSRGPLRAPNSNHECG